MRAIRLPNGNLLVPAAADDPEGGHGLAEIGPEHPDYGRWLGFAEEGADPRTAKADVPPWEQPGALRRDCLPHRGPLLRALSVAGCCFAFLSFCVPVAIPAGLALGILAWVMARQDLARMRVGLMDPEGWARTETARQHAVIATALAGTSVAVWAVVIFPALFGNER